MDDVKVISGEEVAKLVDDTYRLYGASLELATEHMQRACGYDYGKAALMMVLSRRALLYKAWKSLEIDPGTEALPIFRRGVRQLWPYIKREVDLDLESARALLETLEG